MLLQLLLLLLLLHLLLFLKRFWSHFDVINFFIEQNFVVESVLSLDRNLWHVAGLVDKGVQAVRHLVGRRAERHRVATAWNEMRSLGR